MSTRPLADVRVIEFTHAVMGPACGLMLADLGAEVIRVEPATGDPTRQLRGFGTGYFTYFNRNKMSVALDLKSEQGQRIAHKLIADADVLVENFAPGTMDRLGMGFDALHDQHPRLVYCSLKGFLNGPYEHRAALDEVVQMMSGLAYMTGPTGMPLRAGASVVDIMGGMFGAMGVLAALREREISGCGQLVQNGLFETAALLMGQHMAYAAIDGQRIPPMPERVSAWAIYRTFATADGSLVFIGVTSEKHWERFCTEFDRPDLLADARLGSNNLRIAERDWLLPTLEQMIAVMPAEDVLRRCDAAGIPFAPVAHPEDLFEDAHLSANGSLIETMLPDGRSAMLPNLPIHFDRASVEMRSQPAQVGEHTAMVLGRLGYSADDIDQLERTQIIACA